MIDQALYLTNDAHADPAILELLRSQCDEVHVVSTIAQATALIAPSTFLSGGSARHLIVADIAAGGLAFAEYVVSLSNRVAQFEVQESACARPAVVLIDEVGDVNAARKALRLGVDGYLLASDSAETRVSILSQIIAESADCAEGTRERANAASTQPEQDPTPIWRDENTSTQPFDLASTGHSRLSQIEAAIIHCLSAHVGLPISARTIVSEVMGRDMDEDKAASLIRPHISRLRSKVEPMPQMPQRLLTVRGKGYMFVC